MTLIQKIILSTFDMRGVIPSVKAALVLIIPMIIYLGLVALFRWENLQVCNLWRTPLFFWWECP